MTDLRLTRDLINLVLLTFRCLLFALVAKSVMGTFTLLFSNISLYYVNLGGISGSNSIHTFIGKNCSINNEYAYEETDNTQV